MEQTVFDEEFEKEEISAEGVKEAKKIVSNNKKQKRSTKKKPTDELREIPISEFFEKNRHIPRNYPHKKTQKYRYDFNPSQSTC